MEMERIEALSRHIIYNQMYAIRNLIFKYNWYWIWTIYQAYTAMLTIYYNEIQ